MLKILLPDYFKEKRCEPQWPIFIIGIRSKYTVRKFIVCFDGILWVFLCQEKNIKMSKTKNK